jgi:hypothetical protein
MSTTLFYHEGVYWNVLLPRILNLDNQNTEH